jgi:hypothetical protein
MPDGGTLELADGGDAATAALVLRRLAEQFGATAPEAPPGVYVGGPIGTAAELTLFRAVAASFGAVVQDRRPRPSKPWWHVW